ncbi:MAG: lactate racemase domain-containing protein [Thermoguttaceae bacterium]|jgi:nickel-dependent lactate racemase|nr:lactate racemase domain-containing protein [Thermoguttaceae bacterium]
MATLRYGKDAHIELEAAGGGPIELLGIPRGRPIENVAEAVARAIDEPLDYPPLRRATTPGDRVVLALAPGAPRAAETAAVVVRKLVQAGVHPDGITLLCTEVEEGDDAGDPRRLLEPGLREHIGAHIHDPGNRADLAYLAATESGRPILISRVLHEADLVVPIGGVLDMAAAGYFGIHGGIFPAFADDETLIRFRSLGSLAQNGTHKQALIDEANEAAWLLGISFTIQLLPGDGFRVLEVLAGNCETVQRQASDRYAAAWRQPNAAPRASLVVAAIAGEAGIQTWQNLGRALDNAGRLVDDGGAVAVCCELHDPPGPGVRAIANTRSRQARIHALRRQKPIDALPAAQIARALDRGSVYLLSRLEPDSVENLDMVPIANPTELARLTRQHKMCTLLANASCAILE